jgi:hypothetical protein
LLEGNNLQMLNNGDTSPRNPSSCIHKEKLFPPFLKKKNNETIAKNSDGK